MYCEYAIFYYNPNSTSHYHVAQITQRYSKNVKAQSVEEAEKKARKLLYSTGMYFYVEKIN